MTATAAQLNFIDNLIADHFEMALPRDMAVQQGEREHSRLQRAKRLGRTIDAQFPELDAMLDGSAAEYAAAYADALTTWRESRKAERQELIARRDTLTKVEASRLIDLLKGN